ncbi:hypothetical protein [Microlunatus speluncae]|uniref:hypothetical protein n=1 Tax=Microlunatus speluncae TaxID=2594267 RepID=UPI0012667E37|nr:hypothetical protein [Microlunatus speluncae]
MLSRLVAVDPDRPGVGLRLLGDDGPVWAGVLDDVLFVSTGRPWRRRWPGLRQQRVIMDRERIVITAGLAELAVELTFRAEHGRLALDLSWTNSGTTALVDCAVGVQLTVGPPGSRVTMPQVIQHDNPSADPARTVPHVGRGGFVTGEDRLPIPAVCVEPTDCRYVMIIGRPEPTVDETGRVGYDTIGAESGTLIAASGVIMFDGESDLDYVHKATTAPNPRGYRTLEPGAVITRKLLLEWGRLPAPGRGFVALTRAGRELWPPPPADPAGRRAAIALKAAALDARWYADGPVAGYLKFPAWGEPRNRTGPKRRPDRDFSYGWTGQCLRLAWCDAILGLRDHPSGVAPAERIDRCRRVIDFYVAESPAAVPGLRYTGYVHDDRNWIGASRFGAELIFARAHGESLCDLADVIRLFGDHGLSVPRSWSDAVISGAEFVGDRLVGGLVPLGWTPAGEPVPATPSAAGVPAAHAVAAAYRLSGRPEFLDRARELGDAYHALPGPAFDRPYSHATLDAACEDKEAGLYWLRFCLELFDLTGDRCYLDRATEATEWLLSWVYHWSPRFDVDSTLARRGFTAAGWPGVSVQNHHLDVFFPTYELWRLGGLTGHDHFRIWAEGIDTALRQGICRRPGDWGFDVVGEQGEAFFVTDWQQRGASNTWNPSWVIALPLWNALRLEQADGVGAGR